MEVCGTARALPTLPHRRPFSAPFSSHLLLPRPIPSVCSLKSLSSRPSPGVYWLRATASEETSTVVSNRFESSPDELETKSTEDVGYEAEEAPVGPDSEAMGILSKLNLKSLPLDPESAYTILIYGSGALVALWISSAIVGALDSIPLFPKVMEIVGLGFTVWFSYRYLIFKENRDELFTKVEDLKKQIIGSDD